MGPLKIDRVNFYGTDSPDSTQLGANKAGYTFVYKNQIFEAQVERS